MITYVKRKELDAKKYDDCIHNAINSRVYAYSWYLDIICDNWDALILDDYRVVMPLPRRKKYGINYIYLPPWIQQLGIFSDIEVNQSTVSDFIGCIPRKFKLVDIYFNSENRLSGKHLDVRDNYILPLQESYGELRKGFNKGRKSSIKQASKFGLNIVKNFNCDELIRLFKNNKGTKLEKNALEYDILSKLIQYAMSLNFAESLAVKNDKQELIGGAFFLIDNQRITYLFSVINNEGREKQAMSFLLSYLIKTNSASKFILDFEGSMIKELASFFKSFGAEEESYYHYKKYSL